MNRIAVAIVLIVSLAVAVLAVIQSGPDSSREAGEEPRREGVARENRRDSRSRVDEEALASRGATDEATPSTLDHEQDPSTGEKTVTIAPPSSSSYDACVLAQIGREPLNYRGDVKDAFDILVRFSDGPRMWDAPYLVDLGNGYGWISGDRAGYKRAYMFLVDMEGADKGRVLARVLFGEVVDPEDPFTQYVAINDDGMDEIQVTGIGYDGTCASGGGDPASQAQAPAGSTSYEVDNSPEVRPLVPIKLNGTVVEDRSYTNTKKLSEFMFDDGGRITQKFLDHNGLGGTPHWVYQRQIVVAKADVTESGDQSIIGFVYYDALDPEVVIGGG